MKYNILGFVSLVLCFATCAIVTPKILHAEIQTKAPHAIVFDLNSKTVLLEHEADTAVAPASMSKLAALYVVFQDLKAGALSMDSSFTVSNNVLNHRGLTTFLRAGQVVKVSDLIRGTAIASGNDTCIALAEGVSGSQEEFVARMNEIAQELNLSNSHFTNVTGSPDKEHLMSARDILTLAVRIFEDFPEYYGVFSEKQFTYNGVTRKNFNTLLNYSVGVDGVKTGRSEGGEYGMVASAQRDGRRIFVVTAGLASETERAYETKRLLLYAFNNFEVKTMFTAGSTVGEVKVLNGKERSVPIYVRDDVVISRPKNVTTKDIKVLLTHKSALPAPITKNQEIGSLHVTLPGIAEYEVPVYASKDIKELGEVHAFFRDLYDTIFG